MSVFNAYDVRVHMAWTIPPLLPDLQQLPRIGLLDTSGEIGFAQLIIISYKTTEVEVKLLHSIHGSGCPKRRRLLLYSDLGCFRPYTPEGGLFLPLG
jgi:hypothetical protein